MDFCVVIPAHNEEKTISRIIKEVKEYTQNIVVVDDGSNDETAKIADSITETKVLKHIINMGKGAALKTGCDYAIRNGAKKIVVMDGDGQHEPKEIPIILDALVGKDIVFCYRKQARTMPFVFRAGNRFLSEALGFLFGFKIYDSQCGYRAFTAQSYRDIRWGANDYYMETEMIVRAGRKGLKYAQVPIETIYGDKYKGTTIKDGVVIIGKMLTWRLLK